MAAFERKAVCRTGGGNDCCNPDCLAIAEAKKEWRGKNGVVTRKRRGDTGPDGATRRGAQGDRFAACLMRLKRKRKVAMRKVRNVALLAAMLALPMTSAYGHPSADEAEEIQVAQVEETKQPCPTQIEVQPYIWIEPETGFEYRVLHLHCPGEDDST